VSLALLVCAVACDIADDDARDASGTIASKSPTVAATAKKPSADPDAIYENALARGRKLHGGKDYGGAVAAFEEALAARPDDVRALVELGWAAFHAGDLARAEVELRAAIERASEPRLAGSAWYNLGRVLEQKGAVPDAIAAYEKSLGAREHAAVRKRLEALRGTAGTAGAVASGAVQVDALAGPFVDIAAFCSERSGDEVDAAHVCSPQVEPQEGSLAIVLPAAPLPKPMLDLRFVATTNTVDETAYHLAIQTAAGWFVLSDIAMATNDVGFGHVVSHLGVELVELAAGGTPELLVRVDSASEIDKGTREASYSIDSFRRLCGFGATRRPSCTEEIPVEGESGASGKKHRREERWKLELELAGGKLAIAGDVAKLSDHHRRFVGKHAIAWK
jgi:hypothetical protein